jgi:hypothetical protein
MIVKTVVWLYFLIFNSQFSIKEACAYPVFLYG